MCKRLTARFLPHMKAPTPTHTHPPEAGPLSPESCHQKGNWLQKDILAGGKLAWQFMVVTTSMIVRVHMRRACYHKTCRWISQSL